MARMKLFIAPGGCCCDLSWQCIEVDQQESAEFVHLIRHFFTRFAITMKRFISIEAKLMSPSLQLPGDAVLSSHFVNSLFNFPGFNIRGECFKPKLHSFSVHAAGSVEMASRPRRRRLFVSPPNRLGNCIWRVNGQSKRIDSNVVKRTLCAKQISVEAQWAINTNPDISCPAQQGANRHVACTTERTDHSVLWMIRAAGFANHSKAHLLGCTMRAVKNHCCHNFPYQKEILS